MSKISHWSNFAVEFTTRLRTPSEFSLGWEFLEVRQNNCHRHIQPTCWCYELTSMLSLRVGLESSRSLFKFCYKDNQRTVWNELLSNGLTLSCWAFAFCLRAPSSWYEKLYPGQNNWFTLKRGLAILNLRTVILCTLFADCCQNFEAVMPKWVKTEDLWIVWYGFGEVVQRAWGRPSW